MGKKNATKNAIYQLSSLPSLASKEPEQFCPYKGLMPYDEKDAAFFFGRENWRGTIVDNLIASRLTLLYGASGCGKSSVLGAGVVYHLRQQAQQNLETYGNPEFAVIFFNSWHDDPLTGLLQKIEKDIQTLYKLYEQPLPAIDTSSRRLDLILRAWTEVIGRKDERGNVTQRGKLFIILDQFEEYFLYHPHEDGDGTFAVEFPRAINCSELKANFLISLREEALAQLDYFKSAIPGLFVNRLHIDYLERKSASDAIRKPIREYNRRQAPRAQLVSIEPELVKEVLEQVQVGKIPLGELGRGGVEIESELVPEVKIKTPYLQLVMTSLWNKECHPDGSYRLRIETLTGLGGARKIVEDHFQKQMRLLSEKEREAAARIFEYLVTPAGSKIAYPVLDLTKQTGLDAKQLEKLLEKLSSSEFRLLHALGSSPDHPGVQRYEIFHDVLASAILDWRQKRKEKKLIQDKTKAVALSFVFAVGAAVAVRYALLSKKQEQIAWAHQLAIRAQLIRSQSPNLYETSALLAAESMKRFQQIEERSVEADGALRDSLELLPISISRIRHQDMVEGVAFSPDGQYLATASRDNTARISEVTTGKEIARISNQDRVLAVTFSPDGKYLATASWDNTARISEVTTGKEIARISHQGSVEGVTFSPDGKYLATASSDNTARITEVATGSEIARISHQDRVLAVTFSPDGKYLATASSDNTARISEVTTGKEIARISHQDIVEGVAFSPDGKYLVTASSDNTARVSEVPTGKKIADIPHEDLVVAVVFSPDGKYLATASYDNTARISEVTTGKEIARISHQGSVEELVFSPEGKYLATASSDNTARISEVTTGREIARISHQDSVVAVAFSPEGKYLATGSSDNTARVSEVVPTGREIARISHQDLVVALAFSSEGKYLATASRDNTARVTEVPTGREIARISHQEGVEGLAFSPDGSYLATASRDNTARISEVTTGKEIARISHQDIVLALAFSPDGKYLATASWDNTALISEVTTGIEKARISHQGSVEGLAFSPDGSYLATASRDNTARISEMPTGKKIADISHQGSVEELVFSPDGKYLATASSDNTALISEVPTGKKIADISHQGSVEELVFSPDGKYLATASGDNTARISEVTTGKEIARISHQDIVLAVAFSPHGKYLATASGDNTARISEVTTGKEIARISHQDRVLAVAFSPHGKYLATASSDKTAQLHLASPEALMAEACRRLKRNLTVDEWQNYIEVQLHRDDKTCKDYPIHPSFLKEPAGATLKLIKQTG